MDGPVALGRSVDNVATYPHLHGGLGQGAAPVAVLDVDHVVDEPIRRGVVFSLAREHERDRSIGGLVREATRFVLFDLVQDIRHVVATGDRDAVLLGLAEQVAAARQLRDDDTGLVTDGAGIHVLVGGRAAPHGRDVYSALVSEGAPVDVRHVLVGREIGDLRDEVRDVGELLDVTVG